MSETPIFDRLAALLRDEVPVALATVLDGPRAGAKLMVHRPAVDEVQVEGTLGNNDLDRVVARDALGELAAGRSGLRHYGDHGEAREESLRVFIEAFAAPPRMLLFGAVDFTIALVRVAKVLGFALIHISQPTILKGRSCALFSA